MGDEIYVACAMHPSLK